MAERRDDPTVATQAPHSGDGAPRAPRPSAIDGQLGRYTIVKLLGRGGVGAVYEAHDPELDRRVAIKILREDRDDDKEGLRREAQALAKLVHPNVVMVYDVGIAEDEVFVVMQLVEGQTIDAWLAERELAPREIIAMFCQAAAGLIAAHAAGLVHCDFKPGNILVGADGVVRVSDFGLARATRTVSREAEPAAAGMTTIAGTPAYMAPEQFAGTVTAASDQFAFCVALYECLAGERPFEDTTSTVTTLDATVRGARRPLPRDANLPAQITRALERGMADDPAKRFPSMRALVAALQPRFPWRAVAAAGAVVIAGGLATAYFVTRSEPVFVAWNGADVEHATPLTNFGTASCAQGPTIERGGQAVVFDRTTGDAVDLYAVPLAGGTPRALTSAPATWEWRAQPGRRSGEVVHLVHDQDEVGKSSIAFLDLATGRETPVLTVFAWDAAVSGDAIYYSPDASSGLRVLRGKDDRGLVEPPADHQYFLIAVSPAGDRLAVTKNHMSGGPSELCLVDVAKATARCLAGTNTFVRPEFGSDGRALYYANDDGIVRRELASGRESVIVKDVYIEGGLAIAPDGKHLVYSACYAHAKIVDLTSGQVVVEQERNSHVAVSPTGALAWLRNVRGTNVLVVRMPDGGEQQLTTPDYGTVGWPSFSPDGKRIVFTTTAPNPGLRFVDLDRVGAIQQVTDDSRDKRAVWTPSDVIAFNKSDNHGNELAYLTTPDGAKPRAPSTSTRTVYGRHGDEVLLGGRTAMYWLDVKTGVERPGPAMPEGFLNTASTSPSGNWVVYATGSTGQDLWRVRVDPPGELERLATYAAGVQMDDPTIRDDGHVLATVGKYYGDLVRIPARPGAKF